MLFDPSPASSADGLGHLAAARNLARLNAISPALFPLPLTLAREATGVSESIDLPAEDSESDVSGEDTPAAPALQQSNRQHLHIAAGISQAVVQNSSAIRWTKLETFQALDPGESSHLNVLIHFRVQPQHHY